MRSILFVLGTLAALVLAAAVLASLLGIPHRGEPRERVQYRPLSAPETFLAAHAIAPDGSRSQVQEWPYGDLTPNAESEPVPEGTCRVLGRFVDRLGTAIGGVLVERESDPGHGAVSGPDGRFLWNLADDRDLVSRLSEMRLRVRYPGRESLVLELRFRLGDIVDLGDVELARAGDLSGRVVDSLGNGLSGIRVVVSGPTLPYSAQSENRRTGPASVVESSTTSLEGEFHFQGIRSGLARVWAKGRGTPWVYTGRLDIRDGEESFGLEVVLD